MAAHENEKSNLHFRNKHRENYDFDALILACPPLEKYIKKNPQDLKTIDFSDGKAVKLLNKALLHKYYGVENWDIPPHYLCPPIPGRADYIHYLADLLAASNGGKILRGKHIKCLDIGAGANAVYPIIGNKEYFWSFIAADIDKVAITSAEKIIQSNKFLSESVAYRWQPNPKNYFRGILKNDEWIDMCLCNPPFYHSQEEAENINLRKINQLSKKKTTKPNFNFGGQAGELWCEGGEEQFVCAMVKESLAFKNVCFWFTSLIAKQSSLAAVYRALESVGATEVKTIEMAQGNKKSRFVAWTFLNKEQQKIWRQMRWDKKM